MSQRPCNLVWVFADQLRAQALSGRGDPNVRTPNIDRLAIEGVNFTQAVCGAPWCCSFRGSLLIGRYPHQTGIVEVPTRVPLGPDTPTVAHVFREAGYHTAYFGKWHLYGRGEGREALRIVPREFRGGFDTWLAYDNNDSPFDTCLHGHRDQQEVPLAPLPGFETDALTDLFLEHLRRRADQPGPFFAVLSVHAPHDPYVAPAEDMCRHRPADMRMRPNVSAMPGAYERSQRDHAGYYAAVENLDRNLGRIRAALEACGQWADTHLIFFSDHGDMLGSHGYRGKRCPWEEAIRVPFIVGGGRPFYEHACRPCDAVLTHVDIAPTTLGLCGIQPPTWMAGYDYSHYRRPGLVSPRPDEPDSAYLQHCVQRSNGQSFERPWRAVVTRDGWKYAVIPHAPLLMHNLREDPYELTNLAFNPGHRQQRRRLHERLARWIADTGDDFPLPDA